MQTEGRVIIVEEYAKPMLGELIQAYRRTCTWQEHHAFRNAILVCLRHHGTVGPMGEAPITHHSDGPDCTKWDVECRNPEYWVVDTYWGKYQRDVVVEVGPRHVTEPCLRSVSDVMSQFPFRCVSICVAERQDQRTPGRHGHISVFYDRLLVGGPLFANCRDLASIVSAGHRDAPGR